MKNKGGENKRYNQYLQSTRNYSSTALSLHGGFSERIVRQKSEEPADQAEESAILPKLHATNDIPSKNQHDEVIVDNNSKWLHEVLNETGGSNFKKLTDKKMPADLVKQAKQGWLK